MLNDMSSMTKNKLSNRHQIVPTSTRKTHTARRGVGGMRRRLGKLWKCGNLEVEIFGIQTNLKNENLKIKIHVTKNVGQFWIGRKRKEQNCPMLCPFRLFSPWTETNTNTCTFFAIFPWWANGPYSPLVVVLIPCHHVWHNRF